MPKRLEINRCQPFDKSKLWNDQKYSIQNMLYRQVYFPAWVYEGDFVGSWWSDRSYITWRQAGEKYLAGKSGPFESGQPMQELSEEEFLTWCAEACGWTQPITGARLVRYSDGGGYPVYRIDLYAPGSGQKRLPPLYSGMHAPNVVGYEDDRIRDGWYFSYGGER